MKIFDDLKKEDGKLVESGVQLPPSKEKVGKNDVFVSRAKEYHYLATTTVEWEAITRYLEDIREGKVDLSSIADEIRQKRLDNFNAKTEEIEKENTGTKNKRGRPSNEERGVPAMQRSQRNVRAFDNEWEQTKQFITIQRNSFEVAEAVINFARTLLLASKNIEVK